MTRGGIGNRETSSSLLVPLNARAAHSSVRATHRFMFIYAGGVAAHPALFLARSRGEVRHTAAMTIGTIRGGQLLRRNAVHRCRAHEVREAAKAAASRRFLEG